LYTLLFVEQMCWDNLRLIYLMDLMTLVLSFSGQGDSYSGWGFVRVNAATVSAFVCLCCRKGDCLYYWGNKVNVGKVHVEIGRMASIRGRILNGFLKFFYF